MSVINDKQKEAMLQIENAIVLLAEHHKNNPSGAFCCDLSDSIMCGLNGVPQFSAPNRILRQQVIKTIIMQLIDEQLVIP